MRLIWSFLFLISILFSEGLMDMAHQDEIQMDNYELPIENQSEKDAHDYKDDSNLKLFESEKLFYNLLSLINKKYNAHLSQKLISPFKEIHSPPPE